ncbi:MAG: DUF302 domain-containing protein [Burkholderiales bacterium]|nr:DUF302 domain-containing protein [Burkholderiales bacterium]
MSQHRLPMVLVLALLLPAVLPFGAPAHAAEAVPPGTRTLATSHAFDVLVTRVEAAVEANKMGLVAQASASRGAAGRGVKIAGNAVLMVFRNDYAVRMLQASVPAGIEAPIRFYVTENADGSASLSWRTPSALFAPYRNDRLDALVRELDPIFERIARDAAGP